MSYSKEDLDNYLQKLQEILNDKEDDFLEDTDLKNAAEILGLDPKDIEEVKNDFHYRGKGHLEYKNWQEAIKEFEQLAVLSPKNPDASLGLAQAYLNLWKEERKDKYKEKAEFYANQTLKFAPEYKEAYKIIQQLKQKKKKQQHKSKKSQQNISQNYNYKRERQGKSSPNRLRLTFGLTGIIGIFIFVVFKISNNGNGVNSSLNNPNDFMIVVGKKDPVIWLTKRDYYAQPTKTYIIDPKKGEILKEFTIDKVFNFLKNFGDGMYYNIQNSSFEGRDIYTGEIIDSKDILAKHFDKLSQGIGKTSCNYSCNQITLTLKKDGTNFIYNPVSNTIVSDTEMKTIHNVMNMTGGFLNSNIFPPALDSFDPIEHYVWMPEGDRNQREFPLYRKKLPKIMLGINNRLGWEFQRISNNSSTFLNGQFWCGNQDYAVVKHYSEIGEDGKSIISIMDKTGKVIWRITEKDKRKYLAAVSKQLTQYTRAIIHKDILLLSFKDFQYKDKTKTFPFAIALDIKQKKIIWQYSPSQKLDD